MYFIIKNINLSINIIVECDKSLTIIDLKNIVAEKIGSSACLFRLIHNCVEYSDDIFIREADFKNNDTFYILMKLNRNHAIHEVLIKNHKKIPILYEDNFINRDWIYKTLNYDGKLEEKNPIEIGRTEIWCIFGDSNILTFNKFCKEFTLLNELVVLDISLTEQVTYIPKEIGNMNNLKKLVLCDCDANLVMPDEFYTLINLDVLIISESKGIVMDLTRICKNMKDLIILNLSFSGLKGEIPKEIGNLVKLETLFVNDNEMCGKVPDEILKLTGISEINLSDSNLEGGNLLEKIYESNINELRELILTHTGLTGIIPKNINKFNMRFLWIDGNELTGEIPETLCKVCRYENIIRLSGNKLYGKITPNIAFFIEDCEQMGIKKDEVTIIPKQD